MAVGIEARRAGAEDMLYGGRVAVVATAATAATSTVVVAAGFLVAVAFVADADVTVVVVSAANTVDVLFSGVTFAVVVGVADAAHAAGVPAGAPAAAAAAIVLPRTSYDGAPVGAVAVTGGAVNDGVTMGTAIVVSVVIAHAVRKAEVRGRRRPVIRGAMEWQSRIRVQLRSYGRALVIMITNERRMQGLRGGENTGRG